MPVRIKHEIESNNGQKAASQQDNVFAQDNKNENAIDNTNQSDDLNQINLQKTDKTLELSHISNRQKQDMDAEPGDGTIVKVSRPKGDALEVTD